MPLVVLCGHPASGKSVIAAELLRRCAAGGLACELVDEPSLQLPRAATYQDATHEKTTRGTLKSTAERLVSRECVVILDSLDAIKGYRYELWCVARGASTRYALLHVDTPVDTCRCWNMQRDEGDRYPQHMFDDLAGRFERPDTRNKWDCPLYTAHPAGSPEAVQSVLTDLMAGLTAPAGASGARPGTGDLRPTLATVNPALSGTNLLHDIDRAAQDVIDRIMSAQAASGSGAAGVVDLGGDAGSLTLCRPVTLAELRRCKRAFLKLATKLLLTRVRDEATARRLFGEHVQGALAEGGG